MHSISPKTFFAVILTIVVVGALVFLGVSGKLFTDGGTVGTNPNCKRVGKQWIKGSPEKCTLEETFVIPEGAIDHKDLSISFDKADGYTTPETISEEQGSLQVNERYPLDNQNEDAKKDEVTVYGGHSFAVPGTNKILTPIKKDGENWVGYFEDAGTEYKQLSLLNVGAFTIISYEPESINPVQVRLIGTLEGAPFEMNVIVNHDNQLVVFSSRKIEE